MSRVPVDAGAVGVAEMDMASSVRPAPCRPEKPTTSPLCTVKETLSTTFFSVDGVMYRPVPDLHAPPHR